MKHRYYRAGIFPERDSLASIVFVDFEAANMDSAKALAKHYADAHNLGEVFLIKELPRHDRCEYPREEPAEDGCEECPRHPKLFHGRDFITHLTTPLN